MKAYILRTVLLSLLVSSVVYGPVYAEEPEDDYPLSAEDYDTEEEYTLTAEEAEELERSVSESKADFNTRNDPDMRYLNVTDPELKISYDREAEAFIYNTPNGGGFSLTAPLGGISEKKVELSAEKDSYIVSLLKDGESMLPEPERHKDIDEALAAISDEKVLGAELDKEGEYLFHIRSSTLSKLRRETNDSFAGIRVAGEDSPLWINEIFPPYGYEIAEAAVNGRSVTVKDADRLELEADGKYEVLFKPLSSALPEWVSRFTRDTKAPYLIFTPEITEDPVRQPVSFRPSEQGADIKVFLNNTEISLYNMTAAADGDYRILVRDATGNENEYEFRVMLEEKAPINMYIIIAVVSAVMALIVIVTAHRRMRII